MYNISYDSKIKDDLKKLSGGVYYCIHDSIVKKLLVNPIVFSKPLSHKLKNFRSFRVGDYRVIFKLEKNLIIVLAIGHRSNIYESSSLRLGEYE